MNPWHSFRICAARWLREDISARSAAWLVLSLPVSKSFTAKRQSSGCRLEATVEIGSLFRYSHDMSVINATLDLEDDMTSVVTNMLRQFPKGSRVKLAISEVAPSAPVPSLDEYRQEIVAARERAPRGPWKTTAETMKALREGEQD